MSVSTPTPDFGIPPVPVWRVSVGRYHEMIRAGVVTEEDRLELLDGWLVPKMTQNPPHRGILYRTRESLRTILPAGWYPDSQVPITLSTSEPEPDVVLIRGKSDDYLDRHPRAREVGLVIEVADSTLVQDRILKSTIYAESAIPCYWIVNLVDRRVEVYSDPSEAGGQANYRQQRNYSPGEEVPLLLDGEEICRVPVSSILS